MGDRVLAPLFHRGGQPQEQPFKGLGSGFIVGSDGLILIRPSDSADCRMDALTLAAEAFGIKAPRVHLPLAVVAAVATAAGRAARPWAVECR